MLSGSVELSLPDSFIFSGGDQTHLSDFANRLRESCLGIDLERDVTRIRFRRWLIPIEEDAD
jgi:hypothetical protein